MSAFKVSFRPSSRSRFPLRATCRLAAACLTTLGFAGCSTAPTNLGARADVEATGGGNPVARPARTITSLTPALRCMQNKIAMYRPETVTYGLGEIRDSTRSINVGAREMFATAFSQLHTRNSLVALYVPPYSRIGDGVTSQIEVPAAMPKETTFIITGAISSSDKDVVARQRDVGFSWNRIGIGDSGHEKARVIGLDVHATVSNNNRQSAGASSANSITVIEQGRGTDASLGFSKFGMTFSTVASSSESEGRAVRTLLELSAIETVGKTLNVPYWNCLGGEDLRGEGNSEIAAIQDDWLAQRQANGTLDLWIEDALVARGYGTLPPSGVNPAAVVGSDAVMLRAGRQVALADLRLDPERDDSVTAFNALMAAHQGPVATLPLRGLRVAHEFAYANGATYQIKLQPDRQAHVTCFVRDSAGKTSRFFPNPYQERDVAGPNEAIVVPDGSRVSLQALRAPGGAMEEVLCTASARRFDQVPELAAVAAPLRDLPVRSINELAALIAKASSLGLSGTYRFFVNVRPS